MEYLDFESPLKELEEQLAECKLIGDKAELMFLRLAKNC